MITRKKLLQNIDSAIELQKRLISLLNRHLASAITHGSLGAEERKSMMKRFQDMVLMYTKHSATLQSIREEILGGEENVY